MTNWIERLSIGRTKDLMARAAAEYAIAELTAALQRKPGVRLVAATGASQLEFLEYVTSAPGVDWKRVELFHLDEYIGFGIDHPASFARYIKERIIDKTGIVKFHLLDGSANPDETIRSANEAISSAAVDLAFVGIGENGHLAFNDPPADFETEDPYIIVNLDDACRRQQVGEGWFRSIEDVPSRAISMSVRQILKAESIVCTVPDERKAKALEAAILGPVTPDVPASILRNHRKVSFFVDAPAAKLLVAGAAGTE
jgi:glucosamine-6-phosphate deaminase